MSFEAIAGVAQAEAEAKELISGAELKARQMSAEAENEGKAAVSWRSFASRPTLKR